MEFCLIAAAPPMDGADIHFVPTSSSFIRESVFSAGISLLPDLSEAVGTAFTLPSRG